MKDLFDSTLADGIKQRIMCLHPEGERRRGNTNVTSTDVTLSHYKLVGPLKTG
jgi:hypothetical protein